MMASNGTFTCYDPVLAFRSLDLGRMVNGDDLVVGLDYLLVIFHFTPIM
jgi:hypothetical protein